MRFVSKIIISTLLEVVHELRHRQQALQPRVDKAAEQLVFDALGGNLTDSIGWFADLWTAAVECRYHPPNFFRYFIVVLPIDNIVAELPFR